MRVRLPLVREAFRRVRETWAIVDREIHPGRNVARSRNETSISVRETSELVDDPCATIRLAFRLVGGSSRATREGSVAVREASSARRTR